MGSAVLNDEEHTGLNRPTARASGLPARVYYDDEIWDAERRNWFSKTWMACAFESDVPELGDVVPVEIAGWKLIIVRGRDGQIRAFHNICAHRGTQLVIEPRHGAVSIACPWHRWTYDLSGRLVATPSLAGPRLHNDPECETGEIALRSIKTATWCNIVFINLDGDAAGFDSFISPLKHRLGNYDLNLPKFSGLTSTTEFDANWKLVIEGGIEDYHLPWVHPQEGLNDGTFTAECDPENCYAGFSSRYPLTRDKSSLRKPGAGRELPVFPHLQGKQPSDGLGWECGMFAVPPSAILWVLYNMMVPTLVIPLAPNRTLHRRSYCFLGEAARGDEFEAVRADVRSVWENITLQDVPIARRLQENLRQREELSLPTRFSPYWESAVHHFQKIVASHMRAA